MDTLQAIFSRKSVRSFTNQPIKSETLDMILKAGMSGPSCVNARDWFFLAVRDKETLKKMAEANGPNAKPLLKADTGILVCGDTERAYKTAKDYWIIDGAIAAENMLLAAHALGIGGVWLGVYPEMNRVSAQSALFGLPEHAVPHSILAFGYPEKPEIREIDRMEPSRIRYEKW